MLTDTSHLIALLDEDDHHPLRYVTFKMLRVTLQDHSK